MVLGALLAVAGCTPAKQATKPSESGAAMSGPAGSGTVIVTRAAFEAKPEPWNLTTPQSAVRSYLAWTSYAYRIGNADVASLTMSPDEGVRVDSYIQLNLQKFQLIDQTLGAFTISKPSIEGTRATVVTTENWSYRYVSTRTAGKTVSGPFTASYDATYTVVKTADKTWVVDSVAATAHGTVK